MFISAVFWGAEDEAQGLPLPGRCSPTRTAPARLEGSQEQQGVTSALQKKMGECLYFTSLEKKPQARCGGMEIKVHNERHQKRLLLRSGPGPWFANPLLSRKLTPTYARPAVILFARARANLIWGSQVELSSGRLVSLALYSVHSDTVIRGVCTHRSAKRV